MSTKEVQEEKDYLIKDEPVEDDEDKILYPPPEKFNICQWVCLALFYLVFLFLIAFIIYYSCTWNKSRPNEYA